MADDPVWFFKLSGKSEALAEHVPAFDRFLLSVGVPPAGDAHTRRRSGSRLPDRG